MWNKHLSQTIGETDLANFPATRPWAFTEIMNKN